MAATSRETRLFGRRNSGCRTSKRRRRRSASNTVTPAPNFASSPAQVSDAGAGATTATRLPRQIGPRRNERHGLCRRAGELVVAVERARQARCTPGRKRRVGLACCPPPSRR